MTLSGTHRDNEQRRRLHPVPPPTVEATAGKRAPARGSVAVETNTGANVKMNPGSLTHRNETQRALKDLPARLASWSIPPNPRATALPSWDELRWNADHGRHAPPTGWPHTASVIWSRAVTLPVRALVIWIDWIARCPSRTLAVLVLYVLLAHVPALSWLPWFY